MDRNRSASGYDETVLQPGAGGTTDGATAFGGGADRSGAPGLQASAFAVAGVNGLVAMATPVLALAARLRNHGDGTDPDGLRDRAIQGVEEFRLAATRAGFTGEKLRVAHYLLCATLDDVVLNSAWGAESSWRTQNLQSIFHREAVGGDRVFQLADRLLRSPATNGDLLELAYLCLSLGFEGRMRVRSRGSSELQQRREQLYAAIGQVRGAGEPDLSPNWQGVSVVAGKAPRGVPLWVASAGTVLLLTALFVGLGVLLNVRSNDVAAAATAAAPILPPAVDLPNPPLPAPRPQPVADPAPAPDTAAVRVRKFLEQEIAAGLVEVTDSQKEVLVRFLKRDMFDSGSATLKASSRAVVERVADAIDKEPGAVIVTGHTDNIPIQGSRKLVFPTNLDLSRARAEEVRKLVAAHLKDPARITAEGRADSQPIATNDTPEGRAANRRIDLVLIKPGAAP